MPSTNKTDHADEVPALEWPVEPGWYWALGRVAGMVKTELMTAFANVEDGNLITYLGHDPIYRLSSPDGLPIRFQRAELPRFAPTKAFSDAILALDGNF